MVVVFTDVESRCYTYVSENLVTWKSKKQSMVSRSSVEIEFTTLALSFCKGS